MKTAGQLSQSTKKQVETKNGTGTVDPNDQSKANSSIESVKSKDGIRISPGLKNLATASLSTNVAQQRALLTKKPEGIQISRSKHWKFISSYHGP